MQSRNSTNIDLICLEKARSHTRDRGRRRVKVATAEEIVVMVMSISIYEKVFLVLMAFYGNIWPY